MSKKKRNKSGDVQSRDWKTRVSESMEKLGVEIAQLFRTALLYSTKRSSEGTVSRAVVRYREKNAVPYWLKTFVLDFEAGRTPASD